MEEGHPGRVQITQKIWVKNTNMTECMQKIGYLQSIDKHLPQSYFTSQFF
jgi:hypothetical protein